MPSFPRFLLFILFSATLLAQQKSPPVPSTSPASQAPEALQRLNSSFEDLVAKVSPAVVQVLVTGIGPVDGNRNNTALFARQQGIGSGVIVDPNGYIMTNAHVVENAQRIRVLLPLPPGDSPLDIAPAGKRHIVDAKLIGVHKESDLALLKIDGKDLPTLPLGYTRRIRQGQLVFAIGSPEGLQNSVTMGVISAVARQADPTKPMVYVQTDAPINPGNSGGPLVDMDGYVVGINTFILSEGGGSEGLGFAIPARIVKFVYDSLRKYGHVHRVEIKAGAQEISPDLAEGLGLSQSWGVIIDDVIPGGPAEAAGLKIGDIVVSADDRRVETLPAFSAALYLHPTDQVLKLVVLRGNEQKTLHIPVLEKKDQMDTLADLTNHETNVISRLGILAVTLTEQLRSSLGVDLRIPSGVLVLGRAAELITSETGLQQGDVIHSLNQKPIDSLETLRALVHGLKSGDPVAMQVERDGGLQYVSFEME